MFMTRAWFSSSNTPSPISVVSFYLLTPLYADKLLDHRKELKQSLDSLQALGRIYLATEGINAQISLPRPHFSRLPATIHALEWLGPRRHSILFNEAVHSTTDRDEPPFRQLKIELKPQVLADGLETNVPWHALPEATHLDAETWHHHLKENKNALLLDLRNDYETAIGKFEGATMVPANTFREQLIQLDSMMANKPKNEPVYMYCTGGIRCAKGGSYLKAQGFENVFALKGGIIQYGHYVQQSNSHSLFRGTNFTFDGRYGERITNEALGHCVHCQSATDRFETCSIPTCDRLFLQCDTCRTKRDHKTCSDICLKIAEDPERFEMHRQVGALERVEFKFERRLLPVQKA